jgi:hypothetical protein
VEGPRRERATSFKKSWMAASQESQHTPAQPPFRAHCRQRSTKFNYQSGYQPIS